MRAHLKPTVEKLNYMQPVQICIHSGMQFEETFKNAQWVNKKILILKNFSRILEKFHFSISISRHFHFTFHSRSRSQGIFISLFILDLDLKAFAFHFSFSKWVNKIFISLFTSRKKCERESFSLLLLKLSIFTLAGHWMDVVWLYGYGYERGYVPECNNCRVELFCDLYCFLVIYSN